MEHKSHANEKEAVAKTIFLVDDDAHILDTAKDILEAAGYDVRTSETGEEALKCLQKSPSALMIVDFNLIDTTGVELAVKAKQLCPEMVIVLMTGEESVDLGPAKAVIHSVLTKPVNPAELLALIRKTI